MSTIAPSGPWRVECVVPMTDEERSRSRFWEARAKAAEGSNATVWSLFWSAIGVGALCGLCAVLAHLVPPDRAAAIVIFAFLACLAGEWLYHRAFRRAEKQSRAKAVQESGGRFTLVLDQDGLEWIVASSNSLTTTRLTWGGVRSAEVSSGYIVFRTGRDNYLPMPVQALPAQWTVPLVMTLVEDCIRRHADVRTRSELSSS